VLFLKGLVSKPGIAAEIEIRLDNLSAQPRAVRICKHCGCAMVHVDTLFFLVDEERSWYLAPPVCPQRSALGLLKLVSIKAA